MLEEKKRIYKWDNIKAILICLVVLGHSVKYNISGSDACKVILFFISSFHMPAFIFVSGYFHRNNRIRDKIVFYCVMGTALRILLFAVEKFVCGQDVSLNFLTTDGAAWFMYAMAAWIVLSWLFREYDARLVFVAALILGCFVGYDPDINDTLALSRIIVFFPFYWGGYSICKWKKLRDSWQIGGGKYSYTAVFI